MVIEKNRPLIDPSIKIYSEKTDELPNISFWGLFQVFCTGDSNSTAIIADYLSDNNETRIQTIL